MAYIRKTLISLLALLAGTALMAKWFKAARKKERLQLMPAVDPLEDDADEDPEEVYWPGRQHTNPPWTCWCGADCVLEPDETIMGVWVHKGPGDALASAKEIAQAIADAVAGRYDG